MKAYLKFNCVYCGQHMECEPHLSGRQIRCPSCQHRIVIPATQKHPAANQPLPLRDTWETCLPIPVVEVPTRYRNRVASIASIAVLAERAR